MNKVEIILMERGERTRRRALNSPLSQGSGETVMYSVDYQPWGADDEAAMTAPVVKILDQDDVDVTSTLCSGGGSVVYSYKIEFVITSVSAGARYRVFVKGTHESQIMECWTFLDGQL